MPLKTETFTHAQLPGLIPTIHSERLQIALLVAHWSTWGQEKEEIAGFVTMYNKVNFCSVFDQKQDLFALLCPILDVISPT